jgi:ethanolamine utilization protein EutN
MFLARVIGQVVATKKDAQMQGQRLLILRPMLVDAEDPARFKPGSNTLVAVDNLGAATGQMVLFCQGSSARQASGLKARPVDAAIVGLVDSVDVLGKQIFSAQHETTAAAQS